MEWTIGRWENWKVNVTGGNGPLGPLETYIIPGDLLFPSHKEDATKTCPTLWALSEPSPLKFQIKINPLSFQLLILSILILT